MKIILLKDISKLGKRGDVKEVADGYALNVLIKKGDALQATPGELAKWKAQADSKQHKKELATNTFVQLIDSLRKETIMISNKKHDAKGQLFAQVKENDIVEAVFEKTRFSIDPKQVIIETPIKTQGRHSIFLKQGDRKESFMLEVK